MRLWLIDFKQPLYRARIANLFLVKKNLNNKITVTCGLVQDQMNSSPCNKLDLFLIKNTSLYILVVCEQPNIHRGLYL